MPNSLGLWSACSFGNRKQILLFLSLLFCLVFGRRVNVCVVCCWDILQLDWYVRLIVRFFTFCFLADLCRGGELAFVDLCLSGLQSVGGVILQNNQKISCSCTAKLRDQSNSSTTHSEKSSAAA